MKNAIEISNMTKTYGKARGVTDISFQVEEGDFFGFIGQNGAGKSTTIRSMLGLITPDSGNMKIMGYDAVREKNRVLSEVGYMPSEAVFYRGMKVKDIIAFSASLHRKDCSREASQLCERLSVDVNKKVEELSLGNRKKVSIVCAMQHRPALYVLDEPTSGLDPLMQQEFFRILTERNQEGATIFLSSHVLSEIGKNCRHAGILREGKLIALDTVENLTKSNARRVTLTGRDLGGIRSLPGVMKLEKTEQGITFLYTGESGALLKCLAELEIKDFTVTEPDLEEIFMHFYGGEEK